MALTSWLSTVVVAVSLTEARDAVDRAFVAELAGDFSGARIALEGLVRSSTTVDSEAARALLNRHLAGLDRRAQAFRDFGVSAEGYAARFETLRRRPTRWQDLLWQQATKDLRGLGKAMRNHRIRLVWDRIRGVSREALRAHLQRRLLLEGVRLVTADDGSMRLHVHAECDIVPERHRHRASVEASYVLRGAKSLGSRVFRHAESRASSAEAQRWVTRRVMREMADSVLFELRLHTLRQL